jgi:hypothetical protein
VAGNFSCYYLGLTMVGLMPVAYIVSTMGLGAMMIAAPVFAFGLVAFGFLGMGPVTIAVDSYGPVTDNAQSVYELSLIEQVPNIEAGAEEGLQHRRELRPRQGPCSKPTTAPATPSRPPPSRCSSAPPWSAPPP